jgi:hypothetical protein
LSAHNFLDDLDNLLDDPSSSLASASSSKNSVSKADDKIVTAETDKKSSKPTEISDEALIASQTWAQVIESASRALHEGTQLSQDAIQKNLELAKEQQEGIKALSEATGGWRHATRQAVQEVNATKKNIVILTVISALIAITGFGTTIGVMLQSRTSFANMSNAILENVDDHQTLFSKKLTLKLDELTSSIEQMQASVEVLTNIQGNKSSPSLKKVTETNEANDKDSESIQTSEQSVVNQSQAEVSKTVVTEAKASSPVTSPAVVLAPVATAMASVTPAVEQPAATTATAAIPTAEAWQQLLTQVDQLQQQLQQIEQNSVQQAQVQNQQWQQLAIQVDEKLAARLAKLPVTAPTEPPKTPNSVTAVVDTKPILDQLTRLRQEMAELRLLQQSLKEQVNQVKQSITDSANKPYQYRIPQESERYPR